MTVPALREFIRSQGPSRNIVTMDWSSIWATNKKHIDPVSPQYTATTSENMVVASVLGIKDIQIQDKPKHAKNLALGTKKVVYSDSIVLEQADAKTFHLGEEITLMNWGNAVVNTIAADTKGVITTVQLNLHLEGDVKETEKKITWLSQKGRVLTSVELVAFDHLVSKEKLGQGDDIMDFLTPRTEFRCSALADVNVTVLAEGDIVQFERKGFYRLDRAGVDGRAAVSFCVPTGTEK